VKKRIGFESIKEGVKFCGVEESPIGAIRGQSARRLQRDVAVAKAVREQGLITGAVTKHGEKRFVIIKVSLRQNTILMQWMDDLSANGTKGLPIVSRERMSGGFSVSCPIAVVHRPPPGFVHIQAIWIYRRQSIEVVAQATYRERSSLMAKTHRRLRAAVLERLSLAEKYENEYGWFVSAPAMQRIFAEMGVAE